MFTKGQFLRKKDGKAISIRNRKPLIAIRSCVECKDEPGKVIINGNIRVKPEWFDVITKEQFDELNGGVEQKATKDESPLFEIDSFVRKKNWDLFNNGYPVMRVYSCYNIGVQEDAVMINGNVYKKDKVVSLKQEEASKIIEEWKNTVIAEVLDGRLESVHYREDTGEEKRNRTEQEALTYVFAYNKRNPGKNMNAYRCPWCGGIHCGKIPKDIPAYLKDKKKQNFTKNEQELIKISKKLEILIENCYADSYIGWDKMYCDGYDQQEGKIKYTTLIFGLYKIVATQRHLKGGWVKLFEVIPGHMERYELIPEWQVEGKGMTAVNIPNKSVLGYFECTICCDGKKKKNIPPFLFNILLIVLFIFLFIFVVFVKIKNHG